MRPLTPENMMAVLRASADLGDSEMFFWRIGDTITDPETGRWVRDPEDDDIHLHVNCSDLFAWGSADLEEVTDDNVDVFIRAMDDIRSLGDPKKFGRFAGYLFAARACRITPIPERLAQFGKADPRLHQMFLDVEPT